MIYARQFVLFVVVFVVVFLIVFVVRSRRNP